MRTLQAALVALTMSGCSLIWHGVPQQHASYMNTAPSECKVEHWPYIIDTFAVMIGATVGAMLQSGLIEVDGPRKQFYIPVFMVGSAFVVSGWSGIGKTLACQEEQ